MASASTTMVSTPNSGRAGCRILSTADRNNSKPAAMIKAATPQGGEVFHPAVAEGMLRVGGRGGKLEAHQGDDGGAGVGQVVGTRRARMATLPDRAPMASFAANSSTLAVSPAAPASRP